MTRPQDVQDIYDAIPVAEKSLYWMEGTDRRFDGYNFFGAHPELPIEWFDTSTDVTLNANGKHPNSARCPPFHARCRPRRTYDPRTLMTSG